MFIKPKLRGKFTFKYDPEIIKPNAPKIDMKKPIVAALPIALFIEYPQSLRIGTFIIAPPIPVKDDMNPTINPKNIGANALS